jgi:hypothetical protein
VVWPSGSPDGGNLLHAAAMNGCYDIGQLLVVDYGLDPAQGADPGAGMGGKTPYDLCVKARAQAEAAGQPDAMSCDPDRWVEVMEQATEYKQNGGYDAACYIAAASPRCRCLSPLTPRCALPPRRRTTAQTLIDKRAEQPERHQQEGRKRKRTAQPGQPAASTPEEETKPNKNASPAEKRAAMEARIAEKRRKKASKEL